MSEKKIPQKPAPAAQARKSRPSLMFCLSLTTAAALAAGCATSPITRAFEETWVKKQVFYEDTEGLVECKPETLKAMKENRIAIGSFHPDGVYGSDFEQPERMVPLSRLGDTVSVPLEDTTVEVRRRWGDFLGNGLLIGASVVVGDRVYTRLINYSGGLPDENRQVPVCMEVWHEGKPGVPYLGSDPKNPSLVKVPPRVQVKAVSKYY